MKNLKLVVLTLWLSLFALTMNAQEITSFSGMWGPEFYQDKDKLTWKEIDKMMSESQVAQVNWEKSKKQMLGGMIAGAANFGTAIWFLVNENDHKPVTGPAIAFAGTGLIGSLFFHHAMKNKKEAILNYNESLDNGMSFRMVPAVNENGVGLALKF
ncbi:hypothetical protein D9O36_08940 [Zobellia amurskyensis]|uniref:Uncharacterized protein n=1 Tax=Zobellia amurskyensis TaxID=248905 RepID=A0A7X2ZT69_9FLAO|nr:hypothetical protein [Zobellia amurskyensis]MUH35965.1 hypothetical protein [Zobellia amurskyensis]